MSLLNLHSEIWKSLSVSALHFSTTSPVLCVRPPACRADFPCSGGICPICSPDHRGWTWAVNCSQSSSIATAQCLAEFHSIPITALLALPSLWPLIIKCFLLQWPNPSCFLCLPTKYPLSIHNSLSSSQTNSWAIGTHRSVAFHTAFSLTDCRYWRVHLQAKTAPVSGNYDHFCKPLETNI